MKNIKNVIRDFLKDDLVESDEKELLLITAVENYMYNQWSGVKEEENRNLIEEKRIWKKIQNRIESTKVCRKILFYRIISVASLLLILGLGSFLYSSNNQPEQYVYMVSSGIRSIETIYLPDGTEVQLGANSQLSYPSSFSSSERGVKLKGQAFFNVAPNKEKPFVVHTEQMSIMALGTAFEVFDHKNQVETILMEGSVKVELQDLNTGVNSTCLLNPDEKLVYNKQTGASMLETVDAKSYSAWSNQKFLNFENEKLSMILLRLEAWYGRKIECPVDIADKYRFTFKVRDESLERIAYIMKKSSPIKYKDKEGNLILYVDE